LVGLITLRLPRHKQDLDVVDELRGASLEDLRPQIPALLTWLQDMNWPVARPIADILAQCGIDLIEPVRSVLRSSDDVWKYWLLSDLLTQVDGAVRVALTDEILRLINEPTAGEAAEEVDRAALDVFILINYDDTRR
jgi:hypothetical protein